MQPSNGIGECWRVWVWWGMSEGLGMVGDVGGFGYGGRYWRVWVWWGMSEGLVWWGDVVKFGYRGGCQIEGFGYGRGCWRVWVYMMCFVVTWMMNRSICVNCTCTMYTLMHSFASPPPESVCDPSKLRC